ncbi:Protein snail [Taenia solium]|eukprot:TsM_000398800 transcript=TsM_000398800 gene=TsM_000398800
MVGNVCKQVGALKPMSKGKGFTALLPPSVTHSEIKDDVTSSEAVGGRGWRKGKVIRLESEVYKPSFYFHPTHTETENAKPKTSLHLFHPCLRLFQTTVAHFNCAIIGTVLHEATHTMPFHCPDCGRRFSRLWLLESHRRIHTGERPFVCSVCTRRFADRSNMRAHKRTHRYQ